MALLHILLELQSELGFTLSAAHFNHQLRGDEALRDQTFVEAHCRSLGVPLHVGSADVAGYAKAHSLSTEDAARRLRYDFLLNLDKTARIATAHNAQDNLETMLLHMIRGCSLHGLCGIPPVRGHIVRPLLLTEPAALDAYLKKNGIPHIEDSSNASDDYLRNRIRHGILPMMQQENPGISLSISSLCLNLLQEDALLSQTAKEHFSQILQGNRLQKSGLLALPEAMALRVLALYLHEIPGLSQRHLEAALTLASSGSPSGQITLPGGYQLCREYEFLYLQRKSAPAIPESITIAPGETKHFGSYEISCRTGAYSEAPNALAFHTQSIHLPLIIRARQPGDRIHLTGGTKKISRLMVDLKIPVRLRNTLPIVVCGTEILAMLPKCAAAAYRAKPGENSLILTVNQMEEAK